MILLICENYNDNNYQGDDLTEEEKWVWRGQVVWEEEPFDNIGVRGRGWKPPGVIYTHTHTQTESERCIRVMQDSYITMENRLI